MERGDVLSSITWCTWNNEESMGSGVRAYQISSRDTLGLADMNFLIACPTSRSLWYICAESMLLPRQFCLQACSQQLREESCGEPTLCNPPVENIVSFRLD